MQTHVTGHVTRVFLLKAEQTIREYSHKHAVLTKQRQTGFRMDYPDLPQEGAQRPSLVNTVDFNCDVFKVLWK